MSKTSASPDSDNFQSRQVLAGSQNHAWSLGCISFIVLVSGCSSIKEQQSFVAEDRITGEAAVVRVDLSTSARFANLKFRAGYADADAIAEVFKGEVLDLKRINLTNDQALRAMETAAVKAATIEVEAAYALPPSPAASERIRLAEDRLLEAHSLLRRLRAAATDKVPDAPAERFIIAVSANPSAVFDALTKVATDQGQEKTILKSVRDFSEQTIRREQLRAQAALTRWKDVNVEPPSETANDGQLRDALLRQAARLDDYLDLAP